MQDFSKQALMAFLETSIQKGRINGNTGAGLRAACKKVLEQVADEDDVRLVEIPTAVKQYSNRHPGELAPESLRVYESRVRGAVENFVQSVTDPTGYKPPSKVPALKTGRRARVAVKAGRSKPATAEKLAAAGQPTVIDATPGRITATPTLALPFPLRPTFLAQVVIPRDLTRDEARRLAAFIDSLAQDAPATP